MASCELRGWGCGAQPCYDSKKAAKSYQRNLSTMIKALGQRSPKLPSVVSENHRIKIVRTVTTGVLQKPEVLKKPKTGPSFQKPEIKLPLIILSSSSSSKAKRDVKTVESKDYYLLTSLRIVRSFKG